MTHELKIITPYFQDVRDREKNFEVRFDDRNFQAGDTLVLKEWADGQYTGREANREITYILHGGQFGIEKGYVVMSIK